MFNIAISDQLFELLGYFANGGIVYSDQYPNHLPNWDLFQALVLQNLVEEVPVKPNELIYHSEIPNRCSYYVVTSSGKELYLLEKKARNDRAKQAAEQAAQRAADQAHADENLKKQFKHEWRIAIFNATVGFILGSIADHFFDIVGSAARLWLALKHIFLQ